MPYSKQEIAKGFKEASEGDSGGFWNDPLVKAARGLIGSNTTEAQDQAVKDRLKKLQKGDDE